jgi:large subunit ribosomal protein L22
MISKAELNYLKIAPRKVRLVADLIRGKKIEKAQELLRFTRKRAAQPINKLLKQAFANVAYNYSNIKKENIIISKIIVNEGPAAKRLFPRAQGKGDIIRKRTSHVLIELDEKKKGGKDAIKKKTKAQKIKAEKEKLKKEEEAKKKFEEEFKKKLKEREKEMKKAEKDKKKEDKKKEKKKEINKKSTESKKDSD